MAKKPRRITKAATATADASGAWTFTPTGLANGTHTVVASEIDAAGNSASTSLTFTLDTTAPAVTARLAAIGRRERRQDVDGRGLPSAVRPQERKNRPFRDLEVEAVEDDLLAVGLA